MHGSTMATKFQTTQVKVRDQHGQHHLLARTTEVPTVTFPNGSSGAQAGKTNYTLYGCEVTVLDNEEFAAGNLRLQRF